MHNRDKSAQSERMQVEIEIEEKKRRKKGGDVRRQEMSSAVQYSAEGRGEERRAAQSA